MAIEYSDGDIFKSGCQALVCPVNCAGVMGKGLALEFKKTFPYYFEDYKKACERKAIQLGQVYPWGPTAFKSLMIFSFPTKFHWSTPSYPAYIRTGLEDLASRMSTCYSSVESLAIPALGCGLGGLKWEEVRPLIEKNLGDLDCRVVVFPPK